MPRWSSRLALAAVSTLAATVGFSACASSASTPSPSGVEPPSSATAAMRRDLGRGGPITFGDALPDETAAHLAISLRLDDEAGLAALLADQQNPASPRYHAWVTPQQFGARFGLPEAAYARIADWLAAGGFAVTRYPNRLFIEGHGTVAAVRALLKVQPRVASQGTGTRTFRSYAEELSLPDDIAPLVVKVGGLDTRHLLRHRLNVPGTPPQALGAADMRVLYDMPTTGNGASGLTLAVLGTQEGTQASANADTAGPPFIPPSTTAINTYLTSIASATVAYNPIVLPNTQNDLDLSGSNQEYQLDVEMQSVGAPNAKDIDLVLSPASVVFQTGAQYIVNSLPGAVVVSTSLGDCESEEVSDDGGINTAGSDAYLMRKAVQQGLAEGQTWFAAAGDNGADDCADDTSDTKNGFGGGNATTDFPCTVPEIVCMGGTQFAAAGDWNTAGALTAWQTEVVWNEGSQGGAGGGGQSLLYPKPTWQIGIGPESTDNARDVPDISLTAATATPGVAVYDCGSGQDQFSCSGETTGAGTLDVFGGTSIASPLAAGFFAHLAGQVGCRLGDIHPALYALGAAQHDGGAQPFHDVTSGNNSFPDPKNVTITGFTAGPGYDLASGWGSFDLAKLVDAWPACGTPGGGDGGLGVSEDGGGTSSGEDGGPGVGAGSGSGGGGSSGGGLSPDGGSSGNGATGGGATASTGCSCKAAGSAPANGWLAAVGALGLFTARRRRRTR